MLTFESGLVSITTVDDTALVRTRATAERLLRVMEAHEVELARAAEAKLFPGGPPAQVTIASIMRALVATLMDAAQHLAESDAAYNATLRKHARGSESSSSLLSQDVAEKIALSVELEELVLQHADDAGARLERKLFPDGLPETIGLLGIFQALRRRIARATAPGEADVAIDETIEREMVSVAQLFAELSEICNLPAPSRQIRDVIESGELGELDDQPGE